MKPDRDGTLFQNPLYVKVNRTGAEGTDAAAFAAASTPGVATRAQSTERFVDTAGTNNPPAKTSWAEMGLAERFWLVAHKLEPAITVTLTLLFCGSCMMALEHGNREDEIASLKVKYDALSAALEQARTDNTALTVYLEEYRATFDLTQTWTFGGSLFFWMVRITYAVLTSHARPTPRSFDESVWVVGVCLLTR